MRTIALILMVAATAACAGRQGMQGGTSDPQGSATVVKGSELTGNLLDALRSRVPSMTVDRQSDGCPAIMFRGPRSIRNQGNPSVYIDGTMMVDTCVLRNMNSAEVERVEVYPSGMLSDPRIQRNPFGVIIVYRVKN